MALKSPIGQHVRVGLWGQDREPAGEGADGRPGDDGVSLGSIDEELTFKEWKRLVLSQNRAARQEDPGPSRLSKVDRERWKAKCSIEWERFPELPGVHLSIISSRDSRKDRVVVAAGGAALASLLVTSVGRRSERFDEYRLQYLSTDQTCVSDGLVTVANTHCAGSAS
jgi:hypothetical protein